MKEVNTTGIPDVEIRIIETSGCTADELFYTCQFRKKGAWIWINFITYSRSSAEISQVLARNPHDFAYFKDYNYKRCLEHNEKAEIEERYWDKEREKNKCIRLK